VAGVLTVLVALCLGTYLYDHGRRDLIAKGVRVNGVDVGGLRAAAARVKLQRDLITPLDRPVVVSSGSHQWTMSGRQAGVSVDTAALVDQAVQASRDGSIVSRTWRGLTGGSVNRDIPLRVNYSHAAVRQLTLQVRQALNRPARDASVSPSASGLSKVASRDGLAVDSPRLGSLVEQALSGQAASRTVSVPTRRVLPKVTTAQLSARYPAYIVIDRGGFTLHYYSHLKLQSSYPIAVGMQGLETTPGMYAIQWKQVNPPWYVPNDSWAGSLAGQTIPPGPQDPLKARFMSFNGGAGIHGIDPSEYGTIGHNASHGCVRMTIPDVISLYSKTPVGTPVYII
jgi:lipoprotein-anchoring transpeptidase ErfK/SrfK